MSDADNRNGAFIDGFMADYFAECDEHLNVIRQSLLVLERERGAAAMQALQELFRSFHSVKGLSGMVGLHEAERLSHHMESHLRLLRDSGTAATPESISALIQGTRALEGVIAAKGAGAAMPDLSGVLEVLGELDHASGSMPDALAEPVSTPQWRVVFTPSAELAARGIGVDRIRGLLGEAAQILDASPRVGADGGISFEFLVNGDIEELRKSSDEYGLAITSLVGPEAAAASPTWPDRPPAMLSPTHFVRVELSRLDDLMRMIGDLVISRARLAESLASIEPRVPAADWRPVQDNSVAIDRQLRALREGVMRVRLVRVGEIFRRMPFVVRDLARETGRHVELTVTGQDTEIDKFLVERLMDPILHLVRNAVSHGIEPAAERVARGKPVVGHLRLSASSVGDLVVLEIADDGGGIDVDAVVRRAQASGIETSSAAMDPGSLLSLLCTPGFSTRESVDRASGRGVGMAVVQTTVQELGGRLSLDTTPGEGARFTIELPVTLSITDAILARVGLQMFAVPQAAVREVIEIAEADVRRLEQHEVAPYRGGALPIIRLASHFGLPSSPRRMWHVFVIGRGVGAVGLAVDRIVGQREIVVRPLGDRLIRVEGVAGATDLGDGRAVLILDPARIAENIRERPVARAAVEG